MLGRHPVLPVPSVAAAWALATFPGSAGQASTLARFASSPYVGINRNFWTEPGLEDHRPGVLCRVANLDSLEIRLKQNHEERGISATPLHGLPFNRVAKGVTRLPGGEDTCLRSKIAYGIVTAALCLSLCVSTEQRAYAYVDPGAGLLMLQAAGAVFTGVLFTVRRHIKALFTRDKTAEPRASGRNREG